MTVVEAIETNNINFIKENIGTFNPNQIGEYGFPLLHRAAHLGFIEIIELLIDNGADVDIYDEDHFTPLHSVIDGNESNWYDVIELLVKKGANVNTYRKWKDCNQDEESILITAVRSELWEGVVELLLRNGADVDYIDSSGDKAINYAYDLNLPEIINILKKYGAKYDGKITEDEQIMRNAFRS